MHKSPIMRRTLIPAGHGVLKHILLATTRSSLKTRTAATAMSAGNEVQNSDTTRSSRGESYRHKVTRRDLRFIFPEFLPDPEPRFRNRTVERLMRQDMLRRRNAVEIPEFYVGSVIAVTVSDKNAPASNKEGHT